MDQGDYYSVPSWFHDPTALKVAGVATTGVNVGAPTRKEAIIVALNTILEEIRFSRHAINQSLLGCAIAQAHQL